jgi:hypothetical protein
MKERVDIIIEYILRFDLEESILSKYSIVGVINDISFATFKLY